MSKRKVDQAAFAGVLAAAKDLAPNKTSLLYLSTVKLCGGDGKLLVCAGNGKVWTRSAISETEAEGSASACADAAKLAKAVALLDCDEVEVELIDEGVRVSGGGSSVLVAGPLPEIYPEPQDVAGMTALSDLSLKASDFAEALSSCAFASSPDQARYMFGSLHVDCRGQLPSIAATDGKRFAQRALGNPATGDTGEVYSIPKAAAEALCKLVGKRAEACEVRFSDTQVGLKVNGDEVISQLGYGKIPPLEQVMPSAEKLAAAPHFTIDRDEFIACLRRAEVVLDRETRAFALSLSKTSGCFLTSRAMDVGESQVALAVSWPGEDIKLALNAIFVLEGLKAMKSKTLKVYVTSPEEPVIFSEAEGLLYVLSPINLK